MLPALIRKRSLFFPLLSLPAIYVALSIFIPSLNEWEFSDVQNFLGNVALYLLILVLSLTPLTRLFPKWRLAQALNTHRRSIGISCYLYAVLHFCCYLISMPALSSMVQDIKEFTYLQLGLLALVLLTPLFLTSNQISVRILGFNKWKHIHRLAYVAAAAIFLHRSFGEKIQLFQTILIFFPLLVLESLRILKNIIGLFRKKKPAPAPAPSIQKEKPAWEGYREFRVDKKTPERGGICSFYLKPVDGKPLPPFKPGQYLTFNFDVPGHEEPILRCYSISDYYRISVKHQPAPKNIPTAAPGISSTHLHSTVQEGDILSVKAPAGKFTLDDDNIRRIALVSSGVGMTPVLSMLNHRVNQGIRDTDEIWFFHGARTSAGHFMVEFLEKIADKNPQIQVRVCYSRPAPEDKFGKQYHQIGRMGAEFIRHQLPDKDFDFYICGPTPMMAEVVHGLEDWGVAPEKIHFEAFGPSTVQRRIPLPKNENDAPACKVTFSKSKKELEWNGDGDSLLELAEGAGLKMPFGCRAGVCGACKQTVLQGEIEYDSPPAADPGKGACLLCQAKPKGDVTIAA